METENTPKTTNTSDKLLLLRKEYKKTTVAMAKARAHLNSVQRSTKPPRVCEVFRFPVGLI